MGVDFESVNAALLKRLPDDQWGAVSSSAMCDIAPEFLGFVDVYAHLAQIIPPHFTVVDLGCAYAPQAFLFEGHRQYIGVDVGEVHARFHARNTFHYQMTIADFIARLGTTLDRDETFAICSYVPDWHGHRHNASDVRAFFPNVFCFYPSDKAETQLLARKMVAAHASKKKKEKTNA